ncbi:MAG: hypothetical protein LUO90_00595 [Methanoregula sp.]|jgi:hypothetical protein|nr:hypothetical protein [Methanoregula sp.]
MVPESPDPSDHPPVKQRRRGREGAGTRLKKQPAGKKKGTEICVPRPEDLPEEVKCTYPEWQKFLERYPMINSIQREDFPDHAVSFVYVAHLYRTDNTAEESSISQKEFEHFFKDIGYEYNYSGNFESRWYEGIGVKIN